MSGPIVGGLTELLAPPLVQIESVVLELKERNTDLQPSVQFRVAIREERNRFETDKSAVGTTVRRL